MRKKILGIVVALTFAILTANAFAGPITPGNLVVVRFGDGVAALDGKARDVFLQEFTTAGTLVQTLAMPTSGSGSNRQFRNAGTNANEGYLKLSTNGQYMTLFGLDAAAGAQTSSDWSATGRVVGRVGIDGTIDTSTVLTDAGLSGNPRSAVMDGSNIWVGAGSTGGVRYTTFGTVGASTQLSSLTRCREVNIFNGQLYASEQSGPSGHGIYAIGSGLPTTSGQTATLYVNTASGAGNPDLLDYWFADASTVYVADRRTIVNGGGIQKWTLSGSTWSLAYTLTSGLSTGCNGLTGTMVGGNAVLYATSDGISNRLLTVTDTGASSAFTSLFTTGANTMLRGLVLTIPEPATLSLLVLGALVLRRRR
jgi:hypothetical protein